MMKHKLTAKNTSIPESGHSDVFFSVDQKSKKGKHFKYFCFQLFKVFK